MTNQKLDQLFALARELYAEESQKREPMHTPYCWAKNDDTGELVVFSAFGQDSRRIEDRLKRQNFSDPCI